MSIVRRKRFICLCVMTLILLLVGCVQDRGLLENKQATEEEQEMDTGAFYKGTHYYNDYSIYIETPNVGHPSDGSLWSTYYDDDGKNIDVDFYGIEGSLEERIEELTAEGKEVSKGWLWGNECQFYIEKATICMIPLGEEAYLQVEFTHEEDSLAELTRVPSAFTLTIEKER